MERRMNRDGLMVLYSYIGYANRMLLETVERLTAEEFSQQCNPSHGSVRCMPTAVWQER